MAIAIAAAATGASASDVPAWARGGDSVEPDGTTAPAAIEQALQAGLASMSDPPVEDEATQPALAAPQRATPPNPSTTTPTPSQLDAAMPPGATGFNPFTAPRPTTLARHEARAVDTEGDLGLPAAAAVAVLACIGWLLRRLWVD